MMQKLKIFIFSLMIIGGLAFAGKSIIPQAHANITVAPGVCTNCPGGFVPCVTIGFSGISSLAIQQAFEQVLQQFLDSFTNFFDNIFTNFIGNLLTGLNDILEGRFMQWTDNFVAYDLVPAMQLRMGQLNTAYVGSSRAYNSGMDGVNTNRTIGTLQSLEHEAAMSAVPNQQICIAGSVTGGNFARANALMRVSREAFETFFTKRGSEKPPVLADAKNTAKTVTEATLSNSRFAPGLENAAQTPAFSDQITEASLARSYGAGPVEHQKYQWERYCMYLAKDSDNGNNNGCSGFTASGGVQGLDIKPTEFLLNNLVIDVRQEPVKEAMIAAIENLSGLRPPALIPGSSLSGGQGKQAMLDQRSYLARQNAARAVLNKITSERQPTVSDAGQLIANIRAASGSQKDDNDGLQDPLMNLDASRTSYKEIMHVMSSERFATGRYNLDMVGNIENVKREGLVLSVFYLMQLRDYYELLERAVLTLAVQTSIELGGETSGTEGGTR